MSGEHGPRAPGPAGGGAAGRGGGGVDAGEAPRVSGLSRCVDIVDNIDILQIRGLPAVDVHPAGQDHEAAGGEDARGQQRGGRPQPRVQGTVTS